MHNPLAGINPSQSVNVSEIPHYMIALHRLARLNKADYYGGTRSQFVEFDFSNEDSSHVITKYGALLADAERVFIIYDDDRRIKLCL